MAKLIGVIIWFLKYTLVGLVYLYRWIISPITPASCRHNPTCSTYLVKALLLHGPWKGLLLGVNRVSRCHPWGTHGYDPVPKILVKKYRTFQKQKTESLLKR